MAVLADGPLSPLKDLGKWLTGLIPSKESFKKPHFNFITLHYMFMVMMTIIGSIMLYPAGLMPYIDALFFAAGMATQSGLNTIDINTLHTYQQAVMMLVTCICTPIFINTFVVFVRLYWFEKRFEHIVKESRAKRGRNRFTLSRSKSQMRGEKDSRNVDAGVMEAGGIQGRKITVDTDTARFIDRTGNDDNTHAKRQQFKEKIGPSIGLEPVDHASSESSRSGSKDKDTTTASSESTIAVPAVQEPEEFATPMEEPPSPTQQFMGLNPKLRREITFADEVPARSGRESPELTRIADGRDVSKHIEFLERQQANAKKGGALYIPGPRDFDRGRKPEELDEDTTMSRLNTKTSFGGPLHRPKSAGEHSQISQEERGIRRGITLDVPEHPAHREREITKAKEDDKSAVDDADEEIEQSRLARIKSALDRRSSRFPNITDGRRSFARAWTNFTGPREEEPMPYFDWTATTGRNSMFMGLTSAQREELGGIEYRALKTLAKILGCYYVGFHVLGMTVLLPWIKHTQPWEGYVRSVGTDPGWWGVFTPASLFNDLGFTLTPDSMISFQSAVLPLLFGSFLIIIGNTGFPCMLRFIIWLLSKIVTYESELWKELRFLLDHPRRCFTLLFPSKATWWLFWVLIGLNLIDLVFFIILDINQEVVSQLHPGIRVLNGWFQATSTRTAGFASVNLADLHAAIQVSYMIMMYISVFPIAISIRRTNVYEEKSLGIFGGEEAAGDDDEQSYVSQHLRRQLSFDLWYIFLGLFIIAIVEGDRISNTNQPAFTMFSVLFEIVSAYGTVGLSLGYPGINASFSAEFRTISKLIIIAMMIRGRHRGLPYALDRAILLPSDKLQQKEHEEAERRLIRRGSMFAEENQSKFGRNRTWEDGELDKAGLPAQHTRPQSRADQAMTAAAGGDQDPEGLRKVNTRRSTALSNHGDAGPSHQHKRTRSRSLSRVVLSGLSAGPTWSKRD
ncbi:Putative cation transporter [Septoria linicola]|uniref:Potassium transport protein n=1 Tax=Septoria linicola TaxID=215465 RepID=A0A9Q9EI90_9PEZI|nr:putative cation transporter [Septoria linicola]USW51780.1 Putative cation transporter [Septoria linicola]